MITYKTTKDILDKDLRLLYDSVGWYAYTNVIKDLKTLLNECIIVYSAWEDEKLVGLIRTVGDGISIQYVQDILVLPEYQGKGIGKSLLTYVLDRSKTIRQFVLITDSHEQNKDALNFYKKCGLVTLENLNTIGFSRTM